MNQPDGMHPNEARGGAYCDKDFAAGKNLAIENRQTIAMVGDAIRRTFWKGQFWKVFASRREVS